MLLNGSAKNVWYLLYLLTRSNLEFLFGSFWDPLKKYYNLKSRSRFNIHVGWNFIIIFWHSASRIGEVMSMKVNESQIIQAWLTKYLQLRENNHNQNLCLLKPHVSTHSDCSNKRLNIPVSHVCIVGEQVIPSVESVAWPLAWVRLTQSCRALPARVTRVKVVLSSQTTIMGIHGYFLVQERKLLIFKNSKVSTIFSQLQQCFTLASTLYIFRWI